MIAQNDQKDDLLQMLNYLHRVCKENDIWYSLAYGTLLGAVREKGFIPWDLDVDIFVRHDDLLKLRNAIRCDKKSHYHLCVPGVEKGFGSCHERLILEGQSHYDCHIDIYGLIGAPNDAQERIRFLKKTRRLYQFFSAKYKPFHATKKPILLFFTKMFAIFVPDTYTNKVYRTYSTQYGWSDSEYVTVFAPPYYDAYPKTMMQKTVELPFEDQQYQCIAEYDMFLTSLYGDYMTPRKNNYIRKDQSNEKKGNV
ncbi:MAG: LicD family protein [Clostridia bacterium]|nr:LicD family protein [Clostridia bacterium]